MYMHIFCSLLFGEIREGINEMKLEFVAGVEVMSWMLVAASQRMLRWVCPISYGATMFLDVSLFGTVSQLLC